MISIVNARRPRRFHQVDVFTAQPLKGNPLAVMHDAADLDDATMAAFARWTNLSETAFLLPPTGVQVADQPAVRADYRVRIFTPGGGLPFAGHPTLGSCWAWLAAGGQQAGSRRAAEAGWHGGAGMWRRSCARAPGRGGRIRPAGLRRTAAPPLRRSGPLDAELMARAVAALGLQGSDVLHHQWVDNDPGWWALMLASAQQVLTSDQQVLTSDQQVLAVQPDPVALRGFKLGLLGARMAGADTQFEMRAFIPVMGVLEDPVTGSLNAGLAQWLIGAGLAPPSHGAAQGTALARAGRAHVHVPVQQQGADIWIGGDGWSCIEGQVVL